MAITEILSKDLKIIFYLDLNKLNIPYYRSLIRWIWLMGEDILSVIYLLLVIALVFPGFYYANKNKKVFLKNLIIWLGIIGIVIIFANFLK